MWKVYSYCTWKAFWTAPRELMCTWQGTGKDVLSWNLCATPWHCGLSLGSFVGREEWMLKREQTSKKSHLCCTPNMLELLIYNILDCKPELLGKSTHWEVKCTTCFAINAWNQCQLPINALLQNPCKAVIWKRSSFSKYNILELKVLSLILGSSIDDLGVNFLRLYCRLISHILHLLLSWKVAKSNWRWWILQLIATIVIYDIKEGLK